MSKVPKFRLPAAFVSPMSIFLIGGVGLFLSRDYMTDGDLEKRIIKEYPQANRDARAKDAAMVELVRRVLDNDPREEARLQTLLHAGRQKNVGGKRANATQQDIDDFGNVPELPDTYEKYYKKMSEEDSTGGGILSKLRAATKDPVGKDGAATESGTKGKAEPTGKQPTIEPSDQKAKSEPPSAAGNGQGETKREAKREGVEPGDKEGKPKSRWSLW